MENKTTLKNVLEELSMLDQEQMKDVMSYIQYLKEIERLNYPDEREYARVQIRRAMENRYSF